MVKQSAIFLLLASPYYHFSSADHALQQKKEKP